MHMVFSGNPGTAKTTVARLFAKIMKDNVVLSTGQLVEVGRSDLVGKYVGWTAKTVKKRFSEAIGGVLFIDEAYSLVDDCDGSYGDEAINTIVQEMENHRDEMVVIFAGYPDKMQTFLSKNPGLRSRIAFQVHFEDYNKDELCSIAKHVAEENGFKLTDDSLSKMSDIFGDAMKRPDFGNGRYVRNLIERSRMAQASRLINQDISKITKDQVCTIEASDIEALAILEPPAKMRIGFCS